MSYAATAAAGVKNGKVAAAATLEQDVEVRAAKSRSDEIGWEMLDKSKFFVLGAALFSGVSTALYPAVVLKTRLQVSSTGSPSPRAAVVAATILRHEGPRGFYRGFATSLAGTVPARALYMAALEVTKSAVSSAARKLGAPDTAAVAVANAAAGVSSAMAAQVVWTPIDVVSQRLMVQGAGGGSTRYRGGVDAFRKILSTEGPRGLYRGFGLSVLTYAPSNAVWWASYAAAQRLIWDGIRRCQMLPDRPAATARVEIAVQGTSAAAAAGAAALVTMPLDTVKTRMQVLGGGGGVAGAVRLMVKEGGGWAACYRGLGPRWASMSMSAVVMVTTYEFLKRVSTKGGCCRAEAL